MTTEHYLNAYVHGSKAPKIDSSSFSNFSSSFPAKHFTLVQLFGTGLVSVAINALLFIAILYGLIFVVLEILDYRRLLKQQTVCLELTPPAFTDKIPHATEQLFVVLHGLRSTRSLTDRLLRRKVALSLELVSTRDKGIRFIARVPKEQASMFKQNVHAYLPDTKITETKDYLDNVDYNKHSVKLIGFKLSRHFAHPLSTSGSIASHDPVAYLTGSMTKLEDNELMALQIVFSPSSSRKAIRERDRLISGVDTSLDKDKRGWLLSLIAFIFKILARISEYIIDGIGEIISGEDVSCAREPKIRGQVRVSPAAQEVLDKMNSKLSQPLFKTNLRAIIIVGNDKERRARISGLKSSLATFNDHGQQSLVAKVSGISLKYSLWQFRNRLLGLFTASSSLLSSSELASLYHFPHSSSGRTENVIKSLSRTLPAPVSLKDGSSYDVLIGQNIHQGSVTPIGLTEAERQRHVYILGGTGNGKTTMMLYSIVQDIQNGKGVAVVDPHGDLAETLLAHIPEDRIKDVVYFNPADLNYPIGLNVLELPSGLDEDELLLEQDFITESVVSLFRKIFSDDDSGGHRIEYVLRNAIHTAYTTKEPTLFTIYSLLTDVTFRNNVVNKLEDEDLKNFWRNEYAQAGGMQRVKMSAGVTSKLGRFLRSASSRRVLEQAHSTIDFDNILAEGKILICNFSKGRIGEDTSSLFGISVLTKLQLSAYRRQRRIMQDRTSFYLYVDEFQNFATPSFLQLLSEARKYKLFMILAEQSPSQQDYLRMVSTILANVGTVICFRSGSPMDEKLLLPLFSPYVDKGELLNLPAYKFYMRIAAVEAHEPLSGETLLIDDKSSDLTANKVIEASRLRYGKKYVIPKKKVARKSKIRTRVKTANNPVLRQAIKPSSRS